MNYNYNPQKQGKSKLRMSDVKRCLRLPHPA